MLQNVQTGRGENKFLWFPAGGFGLFATLLLTLAMGFFTFFLTTFLAIITLLFWNGLGGHTVNYADTYLYVGLPAGLIALVTTFFVLGALWIRSKLR